MCKRARRISMKQRTTFDFSTESCIESHEVLFGFSLCEWRGKEVLSTMFQEMVLGNLPTVRFTARSNYKLQAF